MKKILITICVIAIGTSCSDDDSGLRNNAFDRGLRLRNVAENVIIPAYEDMVAATAQLDADAETFVTELNDENLSILKQQWTDTKLVWKQAQIFNFGPIESLALETSVDNWPTNDFGIESTINSGQPIDQDFLLTVASDRKGLPAIEYLLFSGDSQESIDQFLNSEARQAYLLALTENLNIIANTILNEWVPRGNNFGQTFIESVGNSAGSSATLLANEMIFLQEIVKNFKIATPLGLRTSGEVRPDLVEAPFSQLSLTFAQENVTIIEKVFTGNGNNGFDDYLDALDVQDDDIPLSKAIREQIDASRNALDAIPPPLTVAVTSDANAVENAFIELQQLTVLLKTDMMSSLGLLVTFSDNDGD